MQVVERGGSWCKLRDTTLHLGTRHTTGLQAFSKVLAHHDHGSKPCPLCDKNMLDSSIIAHLLSDHLDKFGLQSIDSLSSAENLLTHMVNCNIDFVYKFWKLDHGPFLNMYVSLCLIGTSYSSSLIILFFIPYMCLYMCCCVYYRAPCRAYINELLTIGWDGRQPIDHSYIFHHSIPQLH